MCLANNQRFDSDPRCDAARLGDDGQTITWREDDSLSRLAAIGFEAPEGMMTEPIDVHKQGRRQS